MSEEFKKSMVPAPMFAGIGEEASFLDYPGKILRALIIIPLAICAAVVVLTQVVAQLIRLPFTLRAKQMHRKERRIELEKTGRLISLAAFYEHSSRSEGLAIRDFDGCLWWTNDIPEIVRQAEERSDKLHPERSQVKHQCFLRLYELLNEPEEEIDRIVKLKYAYLVDIPGGKMPRTTWIELVHESKITMLSFQFKD
jgi:hypothetical protein